MVPFGLRYIRFRSNSSHPRLVRRDRGAFHADTVLRDGLRRIDGHLVVGLVAILDAQIEVFQVNIQVRQDRVSP